MASDGSFTLVSPGYRSAAGRLAFTIGPQLVAEMEGAKYSERSGRLIDGEGGSESMEGKKKEGYF